MDLGDAVAANVRGLRAKRKWQQQHLADLLHISQRSVSTLESGTRADIGVRELADLCDVFGVTLADLLDGSDERRRLGL